MQTTIVKNFDHLSEWIADHLGKPLAFAIALLSIVIWALCGPFAHYSDTWQLIVNTTTTIMTFLMVFLLQNTQNRDTSETHELLKEIRSNQRAMLECQRKMAERLTMIEYELDGRTKAA